MSSKVTFLVENNGTINIIPESSVTPCLILLLLSIFGLLLNSFIALSVLLNSLRYSFYNCLLGHLSAVSVFESLVNIISSVVFCASWEEMYQSYGTSGVDLFCRINSSTMQWSTVCQSFVMCALSADRSILSNEQDKQSQGTKTKPNKVLKIVTRYFWLLTLILVVPFGFNVTQSKYFSNRYCCNPVDVTWTVASLVYIIIFMCIAYYLPWVFIIKAWMSITRRIIKEKRRLHHLEIVAQQRAMDGRSPSRGMGSSIGLTSTAPWSHIWGNVDYVSGEGFRFFVLAGCIVLLYTALVFPNIITVQLTQFQLSYDTEKQMFSNLPPSLYPIVTKGYDSFFTWIRYLHVVFQPLLILCTHKEIRKQSENVLCCLSMHRNSNATSARSAKEKEQKKKYDKLKWQKGDKYKRVADHRTPVLFCTEKGLQIRTMDDADDIFYHGSPETSNESSISWKMAPQFVCESCDLMIVTQPSDSINLKKKIPRLSKTPPPKVKLANELLCVDVEKKEKCSNGKQVRFAQRIKEIPISDGNYSSDDQAVVERPRQPIQIKPKGSNGFGTFVKKDDIKLNKIAIEHRNPIDRTVDGFGSFAKHDEPNRFSFDQSFRRYSDSFTRFPTHLSQKPRSKLTNVTTNDKSLELDLIQNSSLNTSTSSLMLSLSQRMRNRPS